MTSKTTIFALTLATAVTILAFYPKLSAPFDNGAQAYQNATSEKGDRATIEINGVPRDLSIATFAGGCFWCVEAGMEKVPGVISAISGYSGGTEQNPTYQQVARGLTSYTESVKVYYDPALITYSGLLQAFWRMMDPTDTNGQFADRGSQYRPVIFYHNQTQKQAAELSKAALSKSKRFAAPVIVPITAYTNFYQAEEYHQDYYKKNPAHYARYERGSGRLGFVQRTWGKDLLHDYTKYRSKSLDKKSLNKKSLDKRSDLMPNQIKSLPLNSHQVQPTAVELAQFKKPSDAELKNKLTPLQYRVTQHEGTEAPFNNTYWNEKRAGIYVDIVSGEPLFSSTDKYKSGTGWPSFTRPLAKGNIVEKSDYSLFGRRTEIRSKKADSHLGHVFSDGPAPTGLRYCMNSAAMRFIPADELTKQGYGRFAARFKQSTGTQH